MSSQFTDDQLMILEWTNGVTTGLSLLGELFMIMSYLLVPSIRRFSMKLIISLTFADLFYSLANVLTYFDEPDCLCVIEGFTRTLGVMIALGWTLVIMIISYKQVVSSNRRIADKYTRYCVGICLIGSIPSILGLIGHYTNRVIYFGRTLGYCSLVPIDNAFLLIQVPRVIVMIITFVLTFKIIREIRRRLENRNINEYKKLLIYPLLLVICWLPNTLDRLIYVFHDGIVFPSLVLHLAAARIQGFLNALVYGKSEFQRIKNYFFERKRTMKLGSSTESLIKEIYMHSTSDSYTNL